jgi:uncharacterized protein
MKLKAGDKVICVNGFDNDNPCQGKTYIIKSINKHQNVKDHSYEYDLVRLEGCLGEWDPIRFKTLRKTKFKRILK